MTDEELISAYSKESNIFFSRDDKHRRYRDKIFNMYRDKISINKDFRKLAESGKMMLMKDPQYEYRISKYFKLSK